MQQGPLSSPLCFEMLGPRMSCTHSGKTHSMSSSGAFKTKRAQSSSKTS